MTCHMIHAVFSLVKPEVKVLSTVYLKKRLTFEEICENVKRQEISVEKVQQILRDSEYSRCFRLDDQTKKYACIDCFPELGIRDVLPENTSECFNAFLTVLKWSEKFLKKWPHYFIPLAQVWTLRPLKYRIIVDLHLTIFQEQNCLSVEYWRVAIRDMAAIKKEEQHKYLALSTEIMLEEVPEAEVCQKLRDLSKKVFGAMYEPMLANEPDNVTMRKRDRCTAADGDTEFQQFRDGTKRHRVNHEDKEYFRYSDGETYKKVIKQVLHGFGTPIPTYQGF